MVGDEKVLPRMTVEQEGALAELLAEFGGVEDLKLDDAGLLRCEVRERGHRFSTTKVVLARDGSRVQAVADTPQLVSCDLSLETLRMALGAAAVEEAISDARAYALSQGDQYAARFPSVYLGSNLGHRLSAWLRQRQADVQL